MCCYVKFGSSAIKKWMHDQKGTPKIGERWVPVPWDRGVADHLEYVRRHIVILLNLVVLDETVRTLLRRSAWKILLLAARLSRKVIGTDTDRSTTNDFLLMFYSNHWAISYRFWDERRFQSKIANFSHPVYLRVRRRIGQRRLGSNKNKMMGLAGREKSLTISSAVWIQYTNVTDRQKNRRTDRQEDRHRPTSKTAITHSVAR